MLPQPQKLPRISTLQAKTDHFRKNIVVVP